MLNWLSKPGMNKCSAQNSWHGNDSFSYRFLYTFKLLFKMLFLTGAVHGAIYWMPSQTEIRELSVVLIWCWPFKVSYTIILNYIKKGNYFKTNGIIISQKQLYL